MKISEKIRIFCYAEYIKTHLHNACKTDKYLYTIYIFTEQAPFVEPVRNVDPDYLKSENKS